MYNLKFLLLLGCASAISVSRHVDVNDVLAEEWQLFKLEHSKKYDDPIEESFRRKIFLENKHFIARSNQLYELGKVSYKLKINQFADLLNQEIDATMNGFNRTANNYYETVIKSQAVTFIEPAVDVPDSVDWRDKGAVTPVKDQGQCGSCWSFSSTGALEGQYFRKNEKLVSLSEQNLVDCTEEYGNFGCNGGFMESSFQYIKENGGIDTEDSYEYEGIEDTCRYDPANSGATDKGFVRIGNGDENKLKKAVATQGPVAVGIDASLSSFHFYSEGVYDDSQCSPKKINHAVLAVGYGTDEGGNDYWIVKNSWATSWGDNGYILMARNQKNLCGIATMASYPLV